MYIRTKDGVYVLSEAYWAGNKDEILAEAETIEELCDEFVIEYLTSEEVIQIRYPEFQWAKEDFESNKKGTLYGAIRVSGKGLIYVAKMNESGELELIWQKC